MKYRSIDTVKKITSHEPAFHYSVLEVPAQHRSTPLLQHNIIICIDVPLDPEMIIAVQLSRSCTSVRVFAVFAFSRFAARFRVFAFSRENAAHHQRPRHTHFLHSQSGPLSSESFSALACFEKRVWKGPRAGASPETYESLVKSLVLPGEITASIDQVETGWIFVCVFHLEPRFFGHYLAWDYNGKSFQYDLNDSGWCMATVWLAV